LRREAALRGDVDHKHDVPLILAEVDRFAVERMDFQIVKRRDGGGGEIHGGEDESEGGGEKGAHIEMIAGFRPGAMAD
jgi:hypothetical protein